MNGSNSDPGESLQPQVPELTTSDGRKVKLKNPRARASREASAGHRAARWRRAAEDDPRPPMIRTSSGRSSRCSTDGNARADGCRRRWPGIDRFSTPRQGRRQIRMAPDQRLPQPAQALAAHQRPRGRLMGRRRGARLNRSSSRRPPTPPRKHRAPRHFATASAQSDSAARGTSDRVPPSPVV